MAECRLHDAGFFQRADVASATEEEGPIACLIAVLLLDLEATYGVEGSLDSLNSSPRIIRMRLLGMGLNDVTEDDVLRAIRALEKYAYLRIRACGGITLTDPSPRNLREALEVDEDGFVYVIANPKAKLLKIGTSKDPVRRLSELRAQTRADLEIVGTTPGRYRAESAAHRRFADLRVRGEWFRDDPSIRRWIAQVGEVN